MKHIILLTALGPTSLATAPKVTFSLTLDLTAPHDFPSHYSLSRFEVATVFPRAAMTSWHHCVKRA